MPSDKRQTRSKHPPRYEPDLNPDRMAGQNIGGAATTDKQVRFASDIKELTRELHDFYTAELEMIPVVVPGTRLQQGATYLDLRDPERGQFTASAEMRAGSSSWLVPKADVPYPLWNRLIGAEPSVRRT